MSLDKVEENLGMDHDIRIGEIIKYYRCANGLSQEALAENICSREYLGKVERGKCVPTLEMVSMLSERLQVNLFDSFATLLHHHDMETHRKIEWLNEFLAKHDYTAMHEAVLEVSGLDSFQSGEPFQILCYLEAVYHSNHLHDYEEAIKLDEKCLLDKFPDWDSVFGENAAFSNVELSALLNLASCFYRAGQPEEGKKCLHLLRRYTRRVISRPHYSVNRNHHFEMNLYYYTIYNEVCYSLDWNEEQLHLVEEALDMTRSWKYSELLPEFLFLKAILLSKLERKPEAEEYWDMAHHVGKVFYSEPSLKELEHAFREEF